MKQQAFTMRRRTRSIWLCALLVAVGLWGRLPVAGAQLGYITASYQASQPQYGQSIHNGVIANLGIVKFEGRMRWVVYGDDLTVTKLTGDEWCQDCDVLSGKEACEILNTRATHTTHEAALGREAPVLRSGRELCTVRPDCFCDAATLASTFLVPSGVTPAPSCRDAAKQILASWARPYALITALSGNAAASCVTPPFRSALVNRASGAIVATTQESQGTIAPLQGYIWPRADVAPDLRCPGDFSGNTFDRLENQSRYFVMCNASRIATSHTIVNPLFAIVDLVSLAESTVRGVPTDSRGVYSITTRGLLGARYMISPTMGFIPFSSRMTGARSYWLGPSYGTIGADSYTNIPLNLTLVTGQFWLENGPGRPIATVAGGTASAWASAYWPEGLTHYEMSDAGVPTQSDGGVSSGPPTPSEDELRKISQADLRDTSIYLFRESDGELLGSRWGLGNLELGCAGSQDANPQCDPRIGFGAGYQVLVRGFGANVRYRNEQGDEAGQSAVGLELDYNKGAARAEQGLRVGEPARLVFLNHATGYMATLRTTTGSSQDATARQKPIALRPPNLRIWAERKAAASSVYRVGSEGAALTSDEQIQIFTEWVDENGTALPEQLALTGRLAVSSALGSGQANDPKELHAVGTTETATITLESGVETALGAGEFTIRPGFHAVLLRLPLSEPQRAGHFYVHVDGANPEFQGRAVDGEAQPNGPDFSTNETCYVQGGGGFVCAERNEADPEEDLAMRQRPWTHVPVLVPVYHKETKSTEWIRRPEYHFSVLELQELTVTRQTANQGPVVVTSSPSDPKTGKELLTTDTRLDIVWTLNANAQDELERFSGPRTLSWQLPDSDHKAIVDTEGHTAHINNPGTVVAEDLLALRLVQDGDEANVLWEYKFRSIDFHLEKKKTSLLVGKTTNVIAETEPPDMIVTWKIKSRDPKGVMVTVKGVDSLTGALTVAKDSKDGVIELEATGRGKGNEPPVTATKKIRVGCECQECSGPGTFDCRVGSVHATWGLGHADNGQNAGTLTLDGDELNADLGKPAALAFSSLADGVEVVHVSGAIRQIKAPDTILDVVTVSPTSYQLLFYPRSAAGAQAANGVYAISGSPDAQWTVSFDTTLDIQGSQDGKAKHAQYSHDSATNAWSLGKGETDIQQVESLSVQTNGADRVERRKITDTTAAVGDEIDVVSTYRDFGWDELLVLEVVDPEGAALTTRYTYVGQGTNQGRLQRLEQPDGSWVEYDYDDQGRVISETTPWLDGTTTRVVTSDYSAVDSREYAGGSIATPWGNVVLANVVASSDRDQDTPRVVVERIGGVETSRSYYAQLWAASGSRIDVTERAGRAGAPYGDPGNLRTLTLYHSRSRLRDELYVRGVAYPDGRVDTFESEVLATKGRRETVTHGYLTQVDGVSGKSTREVRTEDARGNVVREETWVHTGSAFELASTTVNTYDTRGRLKRSVRSNGTETSASYGCCGYDTQTDEQGITTTFTYDALGRAKTEERGGVTTTHIYDRGGREVETRRQSSSGTLTTKRSYDKAGRLLTSTDEAGLVTSYAYSTDGRTTTVTRPGGATEVTNAYADGRTASVTGTGVVAQYMSYARNADGSQVTETRVGGAASPQVERSVADFLGRSVRSERPGFGGTTEVSESFYNAQGQLVRQTNPGGADAVFAYDAMGNQYRTALDVDGDHEVGVSGTDRVQETDTHYVSRSGGVWQETSQRVYAAEGGSTPTTVSTQRSRMGGFGGGAISESESVDVHGNLTTSRTLLNASGATVTQLVDTPDSAIDQVTISVQGRVIASTSASGLAVAFTYDGFGRRTGVVDGRTGLSTTHYDGAGRVDYVEDAGQHRTSFAYELATGRKIGEINALGKVTRFAYTTRGEVWRTWGDVPYPVEYGYDAQGRRTTMRTYRQALAWNDTSWPMAATGDVTTWEYDAPSGLLSAKRDASGQAVQYTYETGGRLKTRRWARAVSGAPLVTTYNYQPQSGELAQVDYSDATPDVTFAYDRVGRTKQVTDGMGAHVLRYSPTNLGLVSETRTGLVPATLTYKQATSGVTGRSTGMQLGSGYDVTYSYDAQGRVGAVGWNVAGQSDTATYARVPGSELLGSVTYASGLQTTYGYEAARDLKTQVRNVAGGATVSQYDYQYDAVGRRGNVINSGSAFAQPAFSRWDYNDRNELIESSWYLGMNVADVSNPVLEEHRGYGFDPIGNRLGATEAGTSKSYQTNALNEYTTAAGATLGHDADGNLTSDGVRKFTYDAENRLTVVEPVTPANGGVRVRMAYDYFGRRVQKLVDEYSGGTWTNQDDVRWVYAGWNKIEERRTSGGVSTTKNFVWGLDLSQSMEGAGGIGGLLAVVDEAGSQMAFLYDANGNVGQLVDEQGSTVARYEYDAFGQGLVAAGTAANDNAYRFSTKQFDAETGLYYYGYRYYGPGLGRWTQRDPAQEDVGGLNLFAFVANRPADLVDHLGTFPYRNGAFSPRAWTPHPRTGAPTAEDFRLLRLATAQLSLMGGVSVHAALNSGHYLRNVGTPVTQDFGEVIEDEKWALFLRAELADAIVADIEDAMAFVDAQSGSQHGRITSSRWNVSQLATLEWLFALGRVDWAGDGEYQSGECQSLKLKYHMWDPYDFESNDQTRNGLVSSAEYRRLHDVGLASEYLITGETREISIEWKRGKGRILQKDEINFRIGGRVSL